MNLTPETDPPSRSARWCPKCRGWIERVVRWERMPNRCPRCRTALVRQGFHVKPKPGELRPGVVAQFDDPRDRYDPTRELAAMRARLAT